jgi:hypothetical protein
MWESRDCLRDLLKKYTGTFSANAVTLFLANTSDLETQTKCQKAMHHEEIELNFDASCQQIFGLESEILWEDLRTEHFLFIRGYILCPANS